MRSSPRDSADRAARLDRRARRAVVHEAVLDGDLRLGEAGVDVAAADAPTRASCWCRTAPRRAASRPRARPPGPRRPASGRTRRSRPRRRPPRSCRLVATTTATGSPTCLTSPRLSGQCSGVLISTPGGAQTIGSGPAKSPAMSSPVSTATTPSRSFGGRGVDRGDRRVRLGRADHHRVQHARQVDVLGVVPPAGDHPGVLLALHRRADVRGHADTPVPAAAFTASTMLW